MAYQTAEYGRQRSTPAAPDAQTVAIYNTAADMNSLILQRLIHLATQEPAL